MEKSERFTDMGLEPALIKAICDMGFQKPTEVQTMIIPMALANKDLVVQAQTGTGKTAAFGIPMIDKLSPTQRGVQALVLTPTRELAVQVAEDLGKLGRYKGLRAMPIYGGQSITVQRKVLSQRIHIIVGTPGRTFDHVKRGNIDLTQIRILVLDEVDEMFNLGLIEEVRALVDTLPSARQTMMFSATVTEIVEEITKQYTISAQYVYITPRQLISQNIIQGCYFTAETNKGNLLLDLLKNYPEESVMVFCQTRRTVERVTGFLNGAGLATLGLRGDLPQKQRLEILQRFKSGEYKVLITTDVAARGLDIRRVSLVVNYDIPQHPEIYVHRIGRTGRADNTGTAIVFCTEKELGFLDIIEAYTGQSILRKNADIREPIFNDLLSGVTRKDLYSAIDAATQDPSEITRLFIGAGRKNKLRAGDIVGALTGQTGIAGEMIGVIEIYDTYSFVDILGSQGDLVLEKLQNCLIKGRRVKVAKAN